MSGNPDYNARMHDVCVGRGWCGGIANGEPSHVDYLIPEAGRVSAEQSFEWLFQAEGLDPSSEPAKWQKHKDGLGEPFVRHMGADLVDASALNWDVS